MVHTEVPTSNCEPLKFSAIFYVSLKQAYVEWPLSAAKKRFANIFLSEVRGIFLILKVVLN